MQKTITITINADDEKQMARGIKESLALVTTDHDSMLSVALTPSRKTKKNVER